MFHRAVTAFQAVVAVAAVVTVVLLFTAQPSVAQAGTPDPEVGAAVFATNCSACHGSGGEGGVGPALAGGLARFGTADEVTTFVSTGVPGRMPGFETRLTRDEIEAVAQFVWSELAGR